MRDFSHTIFKTIYGRHREPRTPEMDDYLVLCFGW